MRRLVGERRRRGRQRWLFPRSSRSLFTTLSLRRARRRPQWHLPRLRTVNAPSPAKTASRSSVTGRVRARTRARARRAISRSPLPTSAFLVPSSSFLVTDLFLPSDRSTLKKKKSGKLSNFRNDGFHDDENFVTGEKSSNSWVPPSSLPPHQPD